MWGFVNVTLGRLANLRKKKSSTRRIQINDAGTDIEICDVCSQTPSLDSDDSIMDGDHKETIPIVDEYFRLYGCPHSRFSRYYKMLLVMQCASSGFYSSIAGAIYYPVMSELESLFNINEQMINMTVVVYFIFQGVAPSIMGGIADSVGRRPIVLLSVLVYICACIGLACCHNYAQLIALRCIQAGGIAPVIAINSGIMGDVTTKAERGGYVGYVSGFQVLGGALGALIGSGLATRWGWRSIFWFLAVGSGVCEVFSYIVLTETKRTVVGNGSITPKNFISRAPILHFAPVRKMLHLDEPEMASLEPKVEFELTAPKRILGVARINIVLYVAGLQYATWTTHQTAMSNALSTKYGLSVLSIGLCYLPSGLCTMTSVVFCGRYLNWYFHKRTEKHNAWLAGQIKQICQERGVTEEEAKEITSNDYFYYQNLFQDRLGLALITLILSSFGYIAFGWCIEKKAPLGAVLFCSSFGSLFSNCILTMSTTTMVDLFPSKGSTATGCLNLYRCLMSAILIACLTRMVNAMGYGGVFTLLGGVNFASSFLILFLIKSGKKFCFNRNKEEEAEVKEAKELEESKEKADTEKDVGKISDVPFELGPANTPDTIV